MTDEQIQQDIKTIETAIIRLCLPGPFEIRALGGRGNKQPALSGVFDDAEEAAGQAYTIQEDGYAVYYGLNPVVLPATNVLDLGKQPADTDIDRRRWLLVDIDPERPPETCSTKEEKAEARNVLSRVTSWLKAQGWGLPVAIDSGNGYHALYPVDLPADDGGLVQRILSALANKFNTETAKIDERVFNPSRISRLPGTLNRKGTHTAERPHRRAKMGDGGGTKAVPLDLLEAVAALAPAPTTKRKKTQRAATEAPQPVKLGAEHVAKLVNAHRDDDRPALTAEDIILHAEIWAMEQPESIEGEDGSGRFFAVACGLIRGWGLTVDEAQPIQERFGNERSTPPWDAAHEIEHKLKGAVRKAEEEPERIGELALQRLSTDNMKKDANPTKKQPKQGDALLALICENDLWVDAHDDTTTYVTIRDGESTRNLATESTAFAHWLQRSWLHRSGSPATRDALNEAAFSASALAREGGKHEVFTRVGQHDGHVYIDLANDKWEVVEISKTGWRVINDPPVKFIRSKGMLAIPHPEPGGNIDQLREFLNVGVDEDFTLIVGWLLGALCPTGPFTILAVAGEQGSGKSGLSRLCRSLVDPNKAPLRRLYRQDRDLFIAASRSWVLGFDNLSKLSDDQSDALCGLATRGGYSTRTLYANGEEEIFDVTRPIIINGINEVANRPDLLDRCLVVTLPAIDRYKARTEAELDQAFQEVQPQILGCLYDGVAAALANRQRIVLPSLPRMADFSVWVTAAMEGVGWDTQRFVDAQNANIGDATNTVLDENVIASPLRRLLELPKYAQQWPEQGREAGADDLLNELHAIASPQHTRASDWPKRGRDLSAILRRIAPALRRSGLFVEFADRRARQKCGRRIMPITITNKRPE